MNRNLSKLIKTPDINENYCIILYENIIVIILFKNILNHNVNPQYYIDMIRLSKVDLIWLIDSVL